MTFNWYTATNHNNKIWGGAVRGRERDNRLIALCDLEHAHLIAAAPELLAALKRVYHDWDGEPEDMLHVQAAIAKAEGREP